MLFLQDGATGIFVALHGNQSAIRAGDRLEVSGWTAPGNFAPEILRPSFRVLGQAALPPARPVSYQRLMTGAEDSQWVSVRGVVRGITRTPTEQLVLELVTGGERLTVMVPRFADASLPTGLIDAEVSVQGVCGSTFNQKRQLIGFQLYAPTLAHVVVARSAPAIRSRFQCNPFRDSCNSILTRSPPAARGFAAWSPCARGISCLSATPRAAASRCSSRWPTNRSRPVMRSRCRASRRLATTARSCGMRWCVRWAGHRARLRCPSPRSGRSPAGTTRRSCAFAAASSIVSTPGANTSWYCRTARTCSTPSGRPTRAPTGAPSPRSGKAACSTWSACAW